jgi:hypothetical protein
LKDGGKQDKELDIHENHNAKLKQHVWSVAAEPFLSWEGLIRLSLGSHSRIYHNHQHRQYIAAVVITHH